MRPPLRLDRPCEAEGFPVGEGEFGRVLAYVPAVARRYRGCGVDVEELVAAGNLGLVQAALRFDRRRNVKFSTYANWWIRKAILEALEEQGRLVRLPRHQHERLRVLAEARAALRLERGREPEVDELARAAGLSTPDVELLQGFVKLSVSLDQPVSGEDERVLGEVFADPEADNPARSLIRRELADGLRQRLAALSAKEAEVIDLRFGLTDDRPRTLREVGARLGISRERVRQLELQALLKLRRSLQTPPATLDA